MTKLAYYFAWLLVELGALAAFVLALSVWVGVVIFP